MNTILGKKIGEGGCSEIHEWEDAKKIIKLGKSNTGMDALHNELTKTQLAWDHGLPVPRPYGLTEVDGRPGLISERIYGESLMERFMRLFMQPSEGREWGAEDDENIRIAARILSGIHSQSIPSMPPQKEMLIWGIRAANYLTSSEKEQIVQMLDGLPAKYQLCHGDPNPGNILVREGEPVLIDWMNASTGNPEADLAEYIIMMRYAILPSGLPRDVPDFFDSIREHIIAVFCEEYERLTGLAYREVEPWLVPTAARKLSADGIGEEEKERLLKVIREGLLSRS
ncbi:phosphotransferase family protein [Paenibacillus sp. HW567]|uniref:phosphotransferase family protein n=1 Tax=Paenibacillus sp. HW567 TaxID=1034769 RepID=UPI0003683EE5|nr:phosphotransferase [Paenibacillus sp. HW567]